MGKPLDVVQPYEFGDDASKATCLWFFDDQVGVLPDMILPRDPSLRVAGRVVEWPRGSGRMVERWSNQTDSGQNNVTPGEDRWKDRSRTFPGIADAMVANWGREPAQRLTETATIITDDLFSWADLREGLKTPCKPQRVAVVL